MLPGFIRPDLHESLRREGEEIAPLAYYDVETVNVYDMPVDSSLPDGHPARISMERGNAFVARERLIHRLALRPGDLQLFAGRYSLHRVTAVGGLAERHSAIFAYSERPGVVGKAARTRQLCGRVTPAHESSARRTVRSISCWTEVLRRPLAPRKDHRARQPRLVAANVR
jgi:hypothetical protein